MVDILSYSGEGNPNMASAAREFRVPERRLRARWAGQQSKKERPDANKRLGGDEEPAVCLYIDRLEATGAATGKQMITICATDILSFH